MTDLSAVPPIIAQYIRPDEDTGCWEWTASKNSSGYAQIMRMIDGRRTCLRVHRVLYETLVGPIAEGLVTDHLCRNRGCVNPDHIEPVTNTENVRRGARIRYGDVCKRGHARTPENTYFRPDTGTRICRPCTAEREAGRANGWARGRAASGRATA